MKSSQNKGGDVDDTFVGEAFFVLKASEQYMNLLYALITTSDK